MTEETKGAPLRESSRAVLLGTERPPTAHGPCWPLGPVGPPRRAGESTRVFIPSETHSWSLSQLNTEELSQHLEKWDVDIFCSNLISSGRLAPSSSLHFEQCSFQGIQIWQKIQSLQSGLKLVGRGEGWEDGSQGRKICSDKPQIQFLRLK